MKRIVESGLLAVGLCVICSTTTLAQQNYPNRPIRLIVPYTPGGSTTWTSRLIGQRLTDVWGEQVIIDNRPGANTIIGTELVVRSKPDGYTLLSIGSWLSSAQTLMKPPYDVIKDIAPIATIACYENLLVIHPALPVRNLKEFIALARTRPGELNYGTASHGGGTHMAAELLNSVAKIKTTQVPYKGGGQVITDLLGGQIQFFMSVPVNAIPYIKSGRMRAIAITGGKRMAALPEVPSFAESGLPQVSLLTWQGVGAPAATPRNIIDGISAEVGKLAALPDTKEKLAAQGFELCYGNPEQTASVIKRGIEQYAKIIRENGIKTER